MARAAQEAWLTENGSNSGWSISLTRTRGKYGALRSVETAKHKERRLENIIFHPSLPDQFATVKALSNDIHIKT